MSLDKKIENFSQSMKELPKDQVDGIYAPLQIPSHELTAPTGSLEIACIA